jgi:hypothetical protein
MLCFLIWRLTFLAAYVCIRIFLLFPAPYYILSFLIIRTSLAPSLYSALPVNSVNPLTPELNPSAQRCLTIFFIGILLHEPHFVNICVKNQEMQKLFLQFISYICSSYMFRHYIASPDTTRPCAIFYRLLLNWASLTRQLGTLPEDRNVMPKHVGATIHN